MNRLGKLLLSAGLFGLVVAEAGEAAGPRWRAWKQQSSGGRGPVVTHRTYCVWATPAALPSDSRPLVWIVDGAGDLKGCSRAFAEANAEAGYPLQLTVFPWSHGYRRLYADQTDWAHAQARGRELAAAILQGKKRDVDRRVVVVSHSAGCAVALAACDWLPANAVDRMILLAPSVSAGYDLRSTLRAAREGVDVFCSRKDWLALGLVIRVVGTTDPGNGAAAGRVGFQAKNLTPDECAKLRHHFWSPDQRWTGHTGRHHGMHHTPYLHFYVFPLLGVQLSRQLTPHARVYGGYSFFYFDPVARLGDVLNPSVGILPSSCFWVQSIGSGLELRL